jgi:Zn-dependent M28 family amino/carboxypeptidase
MWQYNVVAALPGSSPDDEIAILGAHYDDIITIGDPFEEAPGAHDNASGVAAMLEIARVMKKEDYRPANTIEFVAFGAEELGLYGSYDFASRLASSGKKVRMMLNNDMIAFDPSPVPADWVVNIINYDTSVGLLEDARAICQDYTVLNNFTDNTHQAHSDSFPFAEFGYPALFFMSGNPDPNYHTVNDLASSLNFEYCSEITSLCCVLLVKID